MIASTNPMLFCAGADIKAFTQMDETSGRELVDKAHALMRDLGTAGVATIAAVNGLAFGGGCELAMACDVRIAARSASFGQPEIKLGIIPGAGGTQRLPRAVGKSKAMDLVLTGRMMDAAEAERAGLVSRVVPLDRLQAEALAVGELICSMGATSVMVAKECVNRAFEGTLADGVAYERRLFHAIFATADQKEGMAAFVAKRKPAFTGR